MLRKFLVAAGIAAASTAITAPANATTYFLGVNDIGDSSGFSQSNGYYKGFTDVYLFNIKEAGVLSGFVSSFATLPKLDVYLKEVALDGFSLTQVSSGLLEKWVFNDVQVNPGVHSLRVTGYWGQQGGSYSGNLGLGAAVPEPASWAMMIAGFGLVGAAMRRRTKVKVRFA